MQKHLILLFCWSLFIQISSFSQVNDPDYFRSPIDYPIRLAGNFGEIRPNHFHSGIDIKVPYEGKKIYACADGYISRVRKDAGGYGNVLYINHPNGLMTVYAHLQKFNDQLEKYASEIQYKNNAFEFVEYPDSSRFPVKKGEIIGYAGNTGRSYGPHLHFEIRESEKDIPINPLFFNFNIIDNTKPQIFDLAIYPISGESTVNGKSEKQFFTVIKSGHNYTISGLIHFTGKIGIAVHSNDFMNNFSNRMGIFTIKMFLDDSLIYEHRLDKISFYDTRYINSFIDYEERQITGKKFQKLFVDPGNLLNIYKNITDAGLITAKDEKIHLVKIILSDNFNNKTTLSLKIKGKAIEINESENNTNSFKYNEDNYFVEKNFRAYIRKGSLYKNQKIEYKTFPKQDMFLSDIHQLNSYLVPVHQEMHIAIQPDGLKKDLINKALIVYIDQKNNIEALESTFMNGFIVAKCNKFGKFAVMIDTIPPIIQPEDIDEKNFKEIAFIIRDELSEISKYEAEIDGNPVVFNYDLKNDRIYYVFDNHIKFNKNHQLRVSVFDKKNNKTVFQTEFFK